MSNDDKEFYVGYLDEAPSGLASVIRKRVTATLLVAALLAVILVLAQGRFALAFFEFGNLRDFEGYVSEHPYPTLMIERPAASNTEIPFSRYLLSVPGKQGAQQALEGFDGKKISVRGTLIYRDDQTMIEIDPRSIEDAGATALTIGAPQSLGRFTLRGEVIDSKCYLGVMKPGNMKAHRSCAIRCIKGGIPPVFIARDEHDNAVYLLMVGSDDSALNNDVLDIVADPVVVSGEVLRDGALLMLKADRAAYSRVY